MHFPQKSTLRVFQVAACFRFGPHTPLQKKLPHNAIRQTQVSCHVTMPSNLNTSQIYWAFNFKHGCKQSSSAYHADQDDIGRWLIYRYKHLNKSTARPCVFEEYCRPSACPLIEFATMLSG